MPKQKQDEIKIGHIVYRVKRVKNLVKEGHACHGYIDYNTHTIFIQTKFPKKQQEALLHEIIHGLSEFSNIGLSEKQVGTLANCLIMVMQDNPHLINIFKKR
jgi:hypothetical protein